MGNTLRAGQMYAGYRIERKLGQGGMGEVYIARDRNLPRAVALKLLTSAQLESQKPAVKKELRQRFGREADLVATLQHPSIVTVYDRGEDEGHLWISMEFIEGHDLGEALARGPLPIDRTLRVLAQTASALDYAFETAATVHRDVKPQNILLHTTPNQERAVLTDFGIARALEKSTITLGGALGTWRYAAPEQSTAPETVNRQADVYALGVTLFQMLTGTVPYPQTDLRALIFAHIGSKIPKPSELDRSLPTDLDAVIVKALAKDPEDRYPSCEALAEAAARALAPPPEPPPIVDPPIRDRSKHQTREQLEAFATAAAIEAARKLGRDLSKIKGSGPGGQIVVQDVYRRQSPTPPPQPSPKREKSSIIEAPRPTPLPTVNAIEAAKKLGVDLSKVKGSGPQGQIVAQDVYQHQKPPIIERRGTPPATLSAIEAAKQRGVDLWKIKGSGKDGLILVQDVPSRTPGFDLADVIGALIFGPFFIFGSWQSAAQHTSPWVPVLIGILGVGSLGYGTIGLVQRISKRD